MRTTLARLRRKIPPTVAVRSTADQSRPLQGRLRRARLVAEAGMTTAEYAVGTLAACTFAIVLLAVVKSGQVKSGLSGVILDALGIR